ncbi:hypothetical protein, partial [Mesorhizobium sp. M1C.F.Ca.ET.196.01.1.1]|uniref:hypothetical protein n=1 Tax=Mesorhizobium sp. M1C.F.Ca.ET.196.01.1.1 TaxID=2563928 RepID=UPI001AEE2ABE
MLQLAKARAATRADKNDSLVIDSLSMANRSTFCSTTAGREFGCSGMGCLLAQDPSDRHRVGAKGTNLGAATLHFHCNACDREAN